MTFAAKPVDPREPAACLPADVETQRFNPRGWARMGIASIAKLVGEAWKAVPVSADDPMPTASRGYRDSTAIVVGTNQTPGRAVMVIATVAGDLKVRLASDDEIVVPVAVGMTILPFEARTVVAAGTTATATCFNLA